MRAVLVLVLAALLSSCAVPGPPAPPVAARHVVPTPPSAAHELLAYMGSLRGLDDGRLGAEVRTQRAALQREPSDATRIKAAMALTLLPGEESEIMALLEPIEKKPHAAPEHLAMASFLHELASDRRRLKESAAAAQARLRDERRAQETQRLRADTLQQKLEALTALEKSLSERTVAPR